MPPRGWVWQPTPAENPMGRRKDFNAKVKVVPAGHVLVATRHPHARESPRERRDGMLRIIARALASLPAVAEAVQQRNEGAQNCGAERDERRQ